LTKLRRSKVKISIESKTFARTSARRYRIVDAEERWWWILFHIISSYCGLKWRDINKTNKSYKTNHWTYFPSSKKKFSKRKYVWTMWRYLSRDCCILYSITLLVHWPYMCDTSIDAHWRQLQQFYAKNPQKYQKSWKNLKNSLKVTFLSRTSRNWYTNPIHVIHRSMRINVNYNIYALNNPQKYQKSEKKKNLISDDFVTHVT
jgi:hypothetical protein